MYTQGKNSHQNTLYYSGSRPSLSVPIYPPTYIKKICSRANKSPGYIKRSFRTNPPDVFDVPTQLPIPTYLPLHTFTYLSNHLPTNLPTYPPARTPSESLGYIKRNIRTKPPGIFDLLTYLPVYLLACLPTDLYLYTYLPIRLPTSNHLPTYPAARPISPWLHQTQHSNKAFRCL